MYSITVKIEGIESRRRSAGIMHILIGFYLFIKTAEYYTTSKPEASLASYLFFAISLISIGYGLFRKQFDKRNAFNEWIRVLQVMTFLILGFISIRTGKKWDAVVLFTWVPLSLLLLVSEKRVFKETVIFFEETGLRIPGYYKDHQVSWTDLSEIIVREDFITIFHRKKKYLQYQVMQDLSPIEVAKLNAFCKDKIETVAIATSANQ